MQTTVCSKQVNGYPTLGWKIKVLLSQVLTSIIQMVELKGELDCCKTLQGQWWFTPTVDGGGGAMIYLWPYAMRQANEAVNNSLNMQENYKRAPAMIISIIHMYFPWDWSSSHYRPNNHNCICCREVTEYLSMKFWEKNLEGLILNLMYHFV